MQIRKAKREDLSQLTDLWWQMHTSHYKYDKSYYRLRARVTAHKQAGLHYAKQIGNPKAIFLVAHEDSRIAGYLLAQIVDRPPIFPPSRFIFLETTVIDAQFRGTGLFRMLFTHLLKVVEQYNPSYIELNVDRDNPAVTVYENIGFETRHYKMVYPIAPNPGSHKDGL